MSTKLSLNVFMDKQKSKVIFAEADSRFIDALLTFLACPLGKIVEIREDENSTETPFFGSLYSLSRNLGLDNIRELCEEYRFSFSKLLFPISSLVDELSRLRFDISHSQPVKYYACEDYSCAESPARNIRMQYEGLYLEEVFCDCGKQLRREVYGDYISDLDRKLITKASSFIILDDLRVVPNLNGFSQTLNNLGITDTDDVTMVTLSFDISDMRSLFKLALFSATPLTDLAMKKTEKISTAVKPELFHLPEKNPVYNTSRKMNLKVSLQKSTGKFLFAQATGDFVEFLFSLLFIPIGGVEYLFGGSTAFKCMDNLYRSVRDKLDDLYFAEPRIRNMLINPKLPYGYNFRSQFLILTEETPPYIYLSMVDDYLHLHNVQKRGRLISLKLSNANNHIVNEKSMCIVSDDLSMSPYSILSTIELLKGMGIPLSDVKEMEVDIGFEEELRLLKAVLTSENVLTDGLITPMLKKSMPKREHRLVGQIA